MISYRIDAIVGIGFAFAAAFCVVVGGARGARAQARFDIDKVEKSVVRIVVHKTKDGRAYRSYGSGFVINAQGHVATNSHVVEGAIKILVPDGSWSNMRVARVVWRDEYVDLAVIQVIDLNRPHVALAVPEPKRGTSVWAVGFPGRADYMERRPKGGRRTLQATVTTGVVGKIFNGGHRKDPRSLRRMIQHSAETNPGNSGGPLFNDCHEVIGIHTYGWRTVFERRKDKFVGRTTHGIFNGSHVSVLIKNLKAQNITFARGTKVCNAAAAGTSSIPVMLYVYIAAASVLAGMGVVLSLRKPRERVVRVVETYSEMLRRKRRDVLDQPGPPPRPRPEHAPVAPTGTPPGTLPGTPPLTAAPGWQFSGFDRRGDAVRFVVARDEIAKAETGSIIGRKAALVHHVIDDRSVSRRHARIVPLDGGIGIVDLNSTHGTKVDGRKLKPYADPEPLPEGAEVALGGVTLRIALS